MTSLILCGMSFAFVCVTGCSLTGPEVRDARSTSSADGTGAETLLCRGGGNAKITYNAKGSAAPMDGVRLQFQASTTAAKKETLQPGYCGWTDAGMAAGSPQLLIQPHVDDVEMTWGADGKPVITSEQAPWAARAADANALILFQAYDDKKGEIVVQKCLSISEANGAAGVKLRWTEPIDSTKFGIPANPKIDGKTLQQIVSSAVAGRDDGQLCSACHNRTTASGGYGVEVDLNKANAALVKPTDMIGGKTWAGKGGWAEGFIKNATKPANVKAAFQAWIDSGYQE